MAMLLPKTKIKSLFLFQLVLHRFPVSLHFYFYFQRLNDYFFWKYDWGHVVLDLSVFLLVCLCVCLPLNIDIVLTFELYNV